MQNQPQDNQGCDVLGHIRRSLHDQWRRYRKRHRRCQKRFSEEAVHDSRVETRRLLATLELLRAFLPETNLKKTRRALKDHLDSFDELRDTQVQLVYVRRAERHFPEAEPFEKWLKRRERRFTLQTRRRIRHIKTRRLASRLCKIEKEIRQLRHDMSADRAYAAALRGISKAFDRVARCCQRVRASDTSTIHRTRVAFKRFRYMIEAMAPLLKGVTEDHRHAMRGYQSMMGDIQDVEVLIAALNEFSLTKSAVRLSLRPLREELLRRRRWLVEVYLNASGKLSQFWPPRDFKTGRRSRGRA